MIPFDHFTTAYTNAVHAKDAAAFLALYDENVVIFDTWDAWLHDGKVAWTKVVEAWFGSLGDERVQVRFTPIASTVTGDSAVFCAHVRYAAIDAAGAELRAMENRLSWMLKRGEDGWHIIHEHTSAPIDGGTMKAKLQRS